MVARRLVVPGAQSVTLRDAGTFDANIVRSGVRRAVLRDPRRPVDGCLHALPRVNPCPEPCPELGNSDLTQPALTRIRS
jgi:hypothetical protein